MVERAQDELGDWVPARRLYSEAKRAREESLQLYNYYKQIAASKSRYRSECRRNRWLVEDAREITMQRGIRKSIAQGVYLVQLPEEPDVYVIWINNKVIHYASEPIGHLKYASDVTALKLLAEKGASLKYLKTTCYYDKALKALRRMGINIQ